eukprot:SAG31_NODE_1514_length_8042_cov_6.955936_3_plen_38_part_00
MAFEASHQLLPPDGARGDLVQLLQYTKPVRLIYNVQW